MNLNLLLPFPIDCMKKWLWDPAPEKNPEKRSVAYSGKMAMFHTVCAVAGYVFAVKYAERFGINPLHVAAAGIGIFPNAAKLAITSHIVLLNGKAAIEAGRVRDVAGFIKAIAIASFAYGTSTTLFTSFILNSYQRMFATK